MSNLIVNATSIAQGTLYRTDGTSIALSAIGSGDTIIYNGLASELLELSTVNRQSLTNLSVALGKRALLLRHGDDAGLSAMDTAVFSSLVADLRPVINFRIDPAAKLQLAVGADQTITQKLIWKAKQYGFTEVNVSAGSSLSRQMDVLEQTSQTGMRLILSLDGNSEIPSGAFTLFDEFIPDLSSEQGLAQAAQLVGADARFMLRVGGSQALLLNAELPSSSFGIERNVLITMHVGDENLIAGAGGYSQYLRDSIAQVQLLVDADAQTGVLDLAAFDTGKVADLVDSTNGPISVVVDVSQASNVGIRLRVQDMGLLHQMQAHVASSLDAALYVNGALGQKLSLVNLESAGEAGIKRIEVNGTLQLDIPSGFSGSAVPEILQQIKLLSNHGGGLLTMQLVPGDGVLPTVNAATAVKLARAQILLEDTGGAALGITESADGLHTLLKSRAATQTLKQLADVGYQKIAVTDTGARALFSINEAVAIGKAGLEFTNSHVAEVSSSNWAKLTVSEATALVSAGVDLLSPAAVKGKPVTVTMNWDAYSVLASDGVYFADGATLKVLIKQGSSELAPEHLAQTLLLMSDGGADILDAAVATTVQLNSVALELMSSLELSFGKKIIPTVLLTLDEFNAIRQDPDGLALLRDQMNALHASTFKLDSDASTELSSSDLLALLSVSARVFAPNAKWVDSSANIAQLMPSWDKILATGIDGIEVDSGRLLLSVTLAEKAFKAGVALDGAFDITGTVKQIAAYVKHADLSADMTFHASAAVVDLKSVASSASALNANGVEINLIDTGGALSKLTAGDWSKYASLGVHNVHAQTGVTLTLGAAHSIELGQVIFDDSSNVTLRLKTGETLVTGEEQLLHDAGVDQWIDSQGLSHDLFLTG